VRACAELVGNFTLGIEERGASSNLIADLGAPLGESTCISCGTCAQVCPTGAIIDRASAYRGKEIQLNRTSTVCVGCSVGCGIEVLTRDNNLVRIEGNWQAPVNEGILCKLGRYDPVEETRTRIHTPLVRRDGVLKAATWEEALDAVSSRIKPFFGNKEGGVAALVSPRLPAESIALFQELFAEKIGSDMVTSLDEGAFTSLSATLADELGKSFEGTLDALKSSDCVVVFGADLVEDHQVVGFLVKRALPSGVKLILVTLDENPLEEQADVTIKPGKSADAKTLTGITAAIIKAGMAKNIAELKKEISEETARKLGISMDDLVKAAQLLANSSSPVVILGKRIDPSTKATIKKLIEFCDLFGAKIINLKGHANSVVASQLHLDQPFQLNGHKIAYLALGDEDPSQLMLQKLEKMPCLIVQSSFHNQATALADVVFPTTTWLEQEGHYINMDGRLQHAPRSLKPAEEIWTSKAILTALAGRMGVKLSSDWQNKLSTRTPSATIREEKLTGNLRRYQWQSQK
jgi:formate dehydrogenase major subunit